MKTSIFIVLLTFGMFTSSAFATESIVEKNEAQKNEVKRDANKAINRMDEKACLDTDTECTKKKMEHRTEEAKDAIKDKSSEVKNKVD